MAENGQTPPALLVDPAAAPPLSFSSNVAPPPTNQTNYYNKTIVLKNEELREQYGGVFLVLYTAQDGIACHLLLFCLTMGVSDQSRDRMCKSPVTTKNDSGLGALKVLVCLSNSKEVRITRSPGNYDLSSAQPD